MTIPMQTLRSYAILFTASWLLLMGGPVAGAEQFLIKDGQAQAQIVTAERPSPAVKLAAEELQSYLEKIGGVRLKITDSPDEKALVTVYVGRSAFTDRLGMSNEGLEDGAFRIVSGDGWLALVGRDIEYEPTPPFTMQPAPTHPDQARMLAEWDAKTGSTYANPYGSLRRRYNSTMDLWADDERGSLNAVYEFLRRLGVRWYMPGETGEIVASMSDIAFQPVDEVVRPAFGLRAMAPLSIVYSGLNREDMLWHLRLGLNAHSQALGVHPHLSHGLADVIGRPEMRVKHPEYYAMINGKRDTSRNHACLSSEGLVEETARFARAMFDVYGAKTVSVMPEDGFTFCQCDLCKGKDTPERGRKGQYSDYVWGFVDAVARAVAKTHPDKTINCFSYGTYTLPPEKIEKLSPNVLVGMVHARGTYFPDPPLQYINAELKKSVTEVRNSWLERSGHPMIGWEHYPFTHRGTFLPIYFGRAINAGLKAQKDNSLGEFVETPWGPAEVRGHGLHRPEFNHLNIYVTSRLYWEPDLDLEQLLDEYFRLFYGPAAEPMKEFVEYCEKNWPEMPKDRVRIAHALQLFDAARAKAPPDSAYATRLEALADYLVTLRQLGDQLARPRKDVPEFQVRALSGPEAEFPLDGRLDKPQWEPYLTQFRTANLVNSETGERSPGLRTSFSARWTGGRTAGILHVGIHCEEPDTANLVSDGVDEADILKGDTVELLIETQPHSYYHLVISPSGVLADFDRQGGQINPQWSSKAEVATRIGKNFWSAEVRIPVTGQDHLSDPLHELAGRRPGSDFPWFVNVIRQRVRDGKVEHQIWSPPASKNLHEVSKFGKWWIR